MLFRFQNLSAAGATQRKRCHEHTNWNQERQALTEDEREHVSDGEVEEVVICGGAHVVGLSDNDARAEVADEPRDKDERVDERDGDEGAQGKVFWAKVLKQKLVQGLGRLELSTSSPHS